MRAGARPHDSRGRRNLPLRESWHPPPRERSACGGLFALAPRPGAQEVTLKVAHFLPAAAPAHAQFMEPWARKVEEESGGRISVEIYPAM